MPELPGDWGALCALVLLLGLRHGFDADHLAAIDGLTRLRVRAGCRHANLSGVLFSLGHGCVVLTIAVTVGALSTHWTAPGWLDGFGAWISIAFLLLLGVANLRALGRAAPAASAPAIGVLGAWLLRVLPTRTALGASLVGAVFALSFDTVSQSTLFAMTAMRFGGIAHALALGLLFLLGILATGGFNGWWMGRLIARADRLAARASRLMSLTVALISLLVAALGAGRRLSPAVDGWSSSRELALGAGILALTALGYAVSARLVRPLQPGRQVT